MGFRKNRSCVDNLFCLMGIVHLCLRLYRQLVYTSFVDFRHAFVKVDRSILWLKLYEAGISLLIIKKLQNLYSKTNLKLNINSKTSNPIIITEGILQGEVLSPM